MKTDDNNIRFILGASLLAVLFMNGLYYMMPHSVINPYEYFSGNELGSFQILNIFIGGAVIPLVALITGYTVSHYSDAGIMHLGKVHVFVFILGIVQVFFIFAFDFLPGLVLMGLVALPFLRTKWLAALSSAIALFMFHLIANVLSGYLTNVGSPTDVIYSAIQEVNELTSIFKGADYFAIIGLNIEIFTEGVISRLYELIFTVLPFILTGIALSKMNLGGLMRESQILSLILFMVLTGGGIALKLVQVLTLGSYSGTLIAENFGGPLLALGYFVLLMFLATIIPQRASRLFGVLGEKIITMYIISNIILFLVFYGVGFGLYGVVSVYTMVLITLSVYVFLLLLSHAMKRFNAAGIEHLFTKDSDNNA